MTSDGDRPTGRILYAIEGGGLVKIGVTSGRGEGRRVALQVGSPVPLVLAGTLLERPSRTEAHVHAEFSAARKHGEWFDLSPLSADGRTVAQVLGFQEGDQ